MPEVTFTDRLRHAWNAFANRDPTYSEGRTNYAYSAYSSYRPDRLRFTRGNERSIVTSIYNRIAIDVSAIDLKHVYLDENERYLRDADSGLNNILTLEANIDQTSRVFIHDLVVSMLDEGCVCAVPVDTSINPKVSTSYDILTMRIGKVTQWYPDAVKVNIYNDKSGKHEEITLPKKMVAILENPFYSVMNEPNSTLQRLIRKLNLLDAIDEQSSSGKLDLIIQLPYVVKSDARKQQAEQRRKDIEMQLTGSKYGIAYTDGTERITQLNRPVENNLMSQIEYLTNTLYGQLGMSEDIFKGIADEKKALNYYNGTIEPILATIALEFKRKFLTKTARTQGQSIEYYRDPFRLVPVNDMAEITDKFTRNEVLTSNEIRQIIGMKPSDDPKADQLVNSNLYQEEPYPQEVPVDEEGYPVEESIVEEEEPINPAEMPISALME